MDTPTLISIGMATAVGVLVSQALQKRRNKQLAPAIEAALRTKGALTLPALSEAIGHDGFLARGKVALAVQELVTQGKVRVIKAPEGTPQLQKINVIKYELTG